VDGSIEILKRLDNYLTPVEAESMQETVRHLFKEKLNNLKNEFSNAVQEKRWNEAIRIGETVTQDFPNSRIALEVKDMMDTLRQRASRQAEVARA
jgi:outer membrane protein assembly factor BamD (BamD/ComL family)